MVCPLNRVCTLFLCLRHFGPSDVTMPVPRSDRKGRYAKSTSLWYLVICSRHLQRSVSFCSVVGRGQVTRGGAFVCWSTILDIFFERGCSPSKCERGGYIRGSYIRHSTPECPFFTVRGCRCWWSISSSCNRECVRAPTAGWVSWWTFGPQINTKNLTPFLRKT